LTWLYWLRFVFLLLLVAVSSGFAYAALTGDG